MSLRIFPERSETIKKTETLIKSRTVPDTSVDCGSLSIVSRAKFSSSVVMISDQVTYHICWFTQIENYQGCLLDNSYADIGREDIRTNLQQLLDTQQVSLNTVTTCIHSPHPCHLCQWCPHPRRHPPGQQHGKDLSAAVAGSSSTKDPESIDIISRSLQELYEITNPLYII